MKNIFMVPLVPEVRLAIRPRKCCHCFAYLQNVDMYVQYYPSGMKKKRGGGDLLISWLAFRSLEKNLKLAEVGPMPPSSHPPHE